MKRLLIALATGSVIALGSVPSLHASALAFSSVTYENVSITRGDGTLFSSSDFIVLRGSTEYTVTGSYNGSGIGSESDLLTFDQANAFTPNIGAFSEQLSGGPDAANYTGTSYNPPLPRTDGLTDQLVGSSGVLSGNVLLADGADVALNTVVSLPASGRGNASSTTGLSADFSFEIDEQSAIKLSFTVTEALRAFLGQDQNTANARSTFSFTLTDASDNSIVPVTFTDAPFLLGNNEVTTNTETPDDGLFLAQNGFFSLTSDPLQEGRIYRLSLSTTSTASAQWDAVAVPEPASITLLGLGLLGLAFVATRRRVTF